MPTAKKLPSGSWRVQVFDYKDENGKKHYKSFTSKDPSLQGKKKAELKAAQYTLSVKNVFTENITLKNAIENYISSKSATLSPSTIKSYKCTSNSLQRTLHAYMDTDINTLTYDEIQSMIDIISKERSPKTVRNMYSLIMSSIQKYRPDFVIKVSLPQKERPNLYIPSDNDIKILLNEVAGTELEIPVMLAAFGPMRRGEICALDVKEDINGNIVHVRRNMVLNHKREYIIKSPKTYSSDRYIEFPDFVIAAIKEKGYITTLHPEQITRRFENILIKLDLPHFRFHDLRHYSASVLHALNVPDAYIMQRGGWSSDKVLKQVYRHAMSDRQKQMNAIGNNHFEELYHTKYHTK